MPTITFSGYLLPKGRNITFHDLPKMVFEKDDLKMIAISKITGGEIVINCELSRKLQGDDLVRIYTRVYEATRTTLDVLAFATGNGYTLSLNSYTDATGATREFVIENPAMGQLCKSFDLNNPGFTEILYLFLNDPYLAWALKDLIEANTEPNHASITCARAVESLRTIMTGAETPRAQAWGTFQFNLRVSREFCDLITDTSRGPRHGGRAHIPGDITLEITQRAWQIMDRFIEYRKRGNQPLTEAEFPVL